ncbi:hypothetical protein SPBR_04181 [Sporothrix brasiliensis 5110]|uniref:Peptidase A1 domain-containing protein n=1 Tax=Sporothrix brasiliensis 5110 TaxID=1398154 RepID=A0A0C2F3B4_9PEZI|nr:uncharacterized protein SPBR_04181 [Sporothrix brasiliensis 5110]KIH93389.1 hypothetical protein SPBR_04181 [Sporothrix brasiliensis 5110]
MVARGMNMSIGSPPQPLAFMPLVPLNNTLLYGTDGYCLAGSPGAGPWANAGLSANAYLYDGANDTVLGGSTYPKFTHVADTLRLNSNVTLDGFPMSIALSDWGEQAYTPMMGIGLGTNSTLLNLLASSGQIASRSWSYFWGRTTVPGGASGTSEQLGGSVVFGGYDRAKVTGAKYTQSMTTTEPNCPSQLLVTITDIVLNFANGSEASLFPASSSAAMTACLTPALPTLMWLPLDSYFNTMLDLTNNSIYAMGRSVGIYYWNMRYEPSGFDPYDGDLTITLQSGLSVRIPNDQLVRPHTAIDQTTGNILVNTTAPDLVIDSLQNVQATKLAQLGWQFFSSAYLLVNQDAREFTLWAANPTAAEDLVAVDTTGAEITDFCASSAGTNTTAGSGGAPGPGHASPPTGVIVGSAVAAVAVIGIVVGLLVWWLRRRRRLQATTPTRGAEQDRQDRPGLGVPQAEHAAADHGSFIAYKKTGLDGNALPQELYTSPGPHEMRYTMMHGTVPGERVQYELEG